MVAPVPPLSRRRFLTGSLAAAALIVAHQSDVAGALRSARVRFSGNPFTLGVASGDPTPSGMVLWTRLATDPLAEDGSGGMGTQPVRVGWQVATEESFRWVMASGEAVAHPNWAHSVHVEVDGLEPGRPYVYRFRAGNYLSPVGRTATTPADGASPRSLRLAVASCSNFEHGWFTAYRRLAEDHPDLVLHVGDYLYEYEYLGYPSASGNIRAHLGPETTELSHYRLRHAQYKTDPDLQAAHAVAPWLAAFDDHEVENNWADGVSEDGLTGPAWEARRAAAFQAYWEHLPLRLASRPEAASMQLHRSLRWGDLAELFVLDTRQYRDDQPCDDGFGTPSCADREQPQRSILGAAQEEWLVEGATSSPAAWVGVANQIMATEVDYLPGPERGYYHDGWDGYPASRDRVFGSLAEAGRFPVVLTGDYHRHYACELKLTGNEGAVVGAEFVGTSISAEGDGQLEDDYITNLAENPQILFANAQRGYLRCDVAPGAWACDFRTVDRVTSPGAPARTAARFVVERGVPAVQQD